MKIALVILNWRNAAATIRCVSTLSSCIDKDLSIYIVDNNSGDDSIDIFCKQIPECRLLENTENGGYTGGNNFGLRAAFADGHDAVLILNNDIQPRIDEKFTSIVADILTENPNSLIGLHVHDIHSRKVFPHTAGVFMRMLFRGCAVEESTLLICGCAMIVSRASFEMLGGLDEHYFMYCEELDYSVRVSKSGGCVRCPAELGYVIRDDNEERRPYVYYYQARNLLRLIYLHHVRSWRGLLAIASVLIALKQAFRSGKALNLLFTAQGIISAMRGKTGRNPSVHD